MGSLVSVAYILGDEKSFAQNFAGMDDFAVIFCRFCRNFVALSANCVGIMPFCCHK
jgi:hypothetical protein